MNSDSVKKILDSNQIRSRNFRIRSGFSPEISGFGLDSVPKILDSDSVPKILDSDSADSDSFRFSGFGFANLGFGFGGFGFGQIFRIRIRQSWIRIRWIRIRTIFLGFGFGFAILDSDLRFGVDSVLVIPLLKIQYFWEIREIHL